MARPRQPRADEIFALYNQGKSMGQIAAMIGVTRSVVSGITYREREQAGLENRELRIDEWPDNRAGDERILHVLRLRDAEFSFRDIVARVKRREAACRAVFAAVMREIEA